MNSFYCLLFSSLLIISTNVLADVYKCVDTAGKTSYSQNPCRDAHNTQQKVNINVVAPDPSATAKKNEKSFAQQNEEFKKRKAEKDNYEECLADKYSHVCIGPKEIAIRKNVVR